MSVKNERFDIQYIYYLKKCIFIEFIIMNFIFVHLVH